LNFNHNFQKQTWKKIDFWDDDQNSIITSQWLRLFICLCGQDFDCCKNRTKVCNEGGLNPPLSIMQLNFSHQKKKIWEFFLDHWGVATKNLITTFQKSRFFLQLDV